VGEVTAKSQTASNLLILLTGEDVKADIAETFHVCAREVGQSAFTSSPPAKINGLTAP
jgi:hypothetical protein